MQYSIDALSNLTGVSTFTLRNWERRYGLLKPQRAKNGYRYYTDEDVALIRRVSNLLKEGMRISEIVRLVKEGGGLPESASIVGSNPTSLPQIREFESLYSALIKCDLDKAEYLVARLAARLSDLQLLDLIYEPILERLGEEWAKGKIDVSHEHLASTFIRHRLTQYQLLYSPSGTGRTPKVLCATPSNELHEGGLLLISAHLKLRGTRIYYLGQNLPSEEIRHAAEQINPDLVCLSVSEDELLKNTYRDFIGSKFKVCIGGRAVHYADLTKIQRVPHIHLCDAGGRAGADFIDELLAAE